MFEYWTLSRDEMSVRRVDRNGTAFEDSGSEGAEEAVVDWDQRLDGSLV